MMLPTMLSSETNSSLGVTARELSSHFSRFSRYEIKCISYKRKIKETQTFTERFINSDNLNQFGICDFLFIFHHYKIISIKT